MTTTNVTPEPATNQPAPPPPIDNMGNPVNQDGTPREPEAAPETPEGGQTTESLQKALNDTKAELTRLQQSQNKPTEDPTPSEAPKSQEDLIIQEKVAEDAGVDFSKYSEEYNKDGGLSEDSYKELMAKGFDKQIVDDYIAGQEARVSQQTQQIAEVVGGSESLESVLTWARDNLSPSEIKAYNDSVLNGTDAAKMALQGIHARYTQANGSAPNLMAGETSSNSGEMFKSQYDMVKAMEDKRYGQDPDFTKEVQDKAARAHKAGRL